MTTFNYPVKVNERTYVATSAFDAKFTFVAKATLAFSQFSGVTAGTTTIPLVVLPATSRIFTVATDIVQTFTGASGTTFEVMQGTVTLTNPVTVNTCATGAAGRLTSYTFNANVSLMDTMVSVPTTVAVRVSLSGTTAASTGSAIFLIEAF